MSIRGVAIRLRGSQAYIGGQVVTTGQTYYGVPGTYSDDLNILQQVITADGYTNLTPQEVIASGAVDGYAVGSININIATSAVPYAEAQLSKAPAPAAPAPATPAGCPVSCIGVTNNVQCCPYQYFNPLDANNPYAPYTTSAQEVGLQAQAAAAAGSPPTGGTSASPPPIGQPSGPYAPYTPYTPAAPAPAPYVAPTPAPYVAPTPSPYVAPTTPAPVYVVPTPSPYTAPAPAPVYVAPTPAPYVAPTPAPDPFAATPVAAPVPGPVAAGGYNFIAASTQTSADGYPSGDSFTTDTTAAPATPAPSGLLSSLSTLPWYYWAGGAAAALLLFSGGGKR